MGRGKQTCEGKQHFSHSHILKLIANPVETLTCNACEQQSVTTNKPNFYGCNSCQYFLHENCLNAPRFLDHSSHPSHHLTLHPTPTYSNRSYNCKACGSAGNGFSFCCARCEFDIHMQCALLPQTVLLPPNVHRHELELIFESPFDNEADDENTVFVCDLCHDDVDLNYWLYYCADCDFGTHLQCGNSKPITEQEQNRPVNKPKAEPVLIRKTEEEPINIQETNQEEKEEEEEEAEYQEEEEEEELKNPRSILIDKHPHELELCFGSPYEDKDTMFACDICNIIMDRDESLYYCADCDFVLHLHCASPDAHAFPTSQLPQNLNPNLNKKYPISNPNPKYPISNTNPTVEMKNCVTNKGKRMKHFSHPHDLELSEVEEINEIICSGCEDKFCGSAYKCTKPNCEFTLHKSCFELPRKMQHNAHPNHPLTLYPTVPERRLYFGCNACGEVPKSFVYECLDCNFSLHAKCATSWPENVTREDHQHSLTLHYQWPFPSEDSVYISCKVCDGHCNDSLWIYYCAECKLGTHLKCVTVKKEDGSSLENKEEEEELENMTNEERLMMAMIKAQEHQTRLNFQINMANQNAQFMNNMFGGYRRYY